MRPGSDRLQMHWRHCKSTIGCQPFVRLQQEIGSQYYENPEITKQIESVITHIKNIPEYRLTRRNSFHIQIDAGIETGIMYIIARHPQHQIFIAGISSRHDRADLILL